MSVYQQELQLAPEGGISLTCTHLPLIGNSLAVSVCRRGAPALAPDQLRSFVHSAVPLAAGFTNTHVTLNVALKWGPSAECPCVCLPNPQEDLTLCHKFI
ncbi:hypothetical protein NQZ68_012018 [Dissostichus eleginoides]|nr:hypothetical protein NQZ68_012018 [Dissostichus eleginoides]